MRKLCLRIFSFFVFFILLVSPKEAFCEFEVEWGKSYDFGLTHLTGDKLLAQWLVGNGYYANLNDAGHFARTGYIGHDRSNADPFYWSFSQPIEVQIVQEVAGFADRNNFGYYTDGGHFKTLTQIFSGTDNGPSQFTSGKPFGFYLATPEQNQWFTDRGENDLQDGPLRHRGGNPQALIYELRPGSEWLLAWEDLDVTTLRADNDYNDMYVKVTAVPEPISSALFLLGGGILASARMRKQKRFTPR